LKILRKHCWSGELLGRDQSVRHKLGTLKKIISGGQTGVDRAALDFGIEYDIAHGGWCPKGRKAEDGPLVAKYLLTETPSSSYPQRTQWNVRDSDGSIIFSIAPVLSGGSKKTVDFAIKHNKPWLHLHQDSDNPEAALLKFIREHRIEVLNVAGPRASKEEGVAALVRRVLEAAFFSGSS
jgi:Circularly permutated YpsA SLOG family